MKFHSCKMSNKSWRAGYSHVTVVDVLYGYLKLAKTLDVQTLGVLSTKKKSNKQGNGRGVK